MRKSFVEVNDALYPLIENAKNTNDYPLDKLSRAGILLWYAIKVYHDELRSFAENYEAVEYIEDAWP